MSFTFAPTQRGRLKKEEYHMKNDRNKQGSREPMSPLPFPIIRYETIDSTNTEARRYAAAGRQAPAALVAERQTAGRGRMGRSFYSPGGTGIYLSLLLPVTEKGENSVLLTSGAAVAVARAIEEVTAVHCRIKWVNDLYLEGRKVCGILAESFLLEGRPYVILGVGVNLCTKRFPKELRSVAGSLLRRGHEKKDQLTIRIAEELYKLLFQGSPDDWMEEYVERSLVLGQEVTYWINGEERKGKAVAVNNDGSLQIQWPNGGGERLSSGEISLRLVKTNFEEKKRHE